MKLKNHLLIATPNLKDSVFERAIVYVCEHNKDGAMGLVINKPTDTTLDEVMRQLNINPPEPIIYPMKITDRVLSGGPVGKDKGFILHTTCHDKYSSSVSITSDIQLTSSLDILSTLGTKEEPQNYLMTLGYSGWGAGQLEDEIKQNAWLTVEADFDLLFNASSETRWHDALHKLGIDPNLLTTEYGRA